MIAPLLSAQEDVSVVKTIRSLGLVEKTVRMSSPDFSGGQILPFFDRAIRGPVHYFGPPVLQLHTTDSGEGAANSTYQVALPKSEVVLLLGIKSTGGLMKFIALPDSYDSPGATSVSILNLTRMELFVKVGEEAGVIGVGTIYRQDYPAGEYDELPVSIAGKSGDSLVPIINNKLRLMPRRTVMLLVAGDEAVKARRLDRGEVEVSVVYRSPLLPSPSNP
ncbi:MAG: hypothetical protein Q7Q73_14465 [Verrucomicrobiota bacterium JB024]|nr:hypothetical protein [Verrucomicrobiota bacterium JB024]